MVNETRNPRAYELMSVLVPDLSDDDTAGAIERVRNYITAVNGDISKVNTDSPWGRRRLAYTVRFNGQDYRDGIYVLTHFSTVPSSIGDIERELKLDTAVMRYLLVMDDPKAGEQTPEDAAAPESSETGETAAAPTEASGATEQAAATTESAPAEATEAPVAPEESASEPAPAESGEAPAARAAQASSRLPTEGEGELWVAGDGTANVPEGFPIKGNATSRIYHPEASPSYRNTIAELYFATPEAAESMGYRLPKTMQNAGAAAAGTAASLAEQAAEAAEAMSGEEAPAPADAATTKEA